jgi:hypothetical protein
VASVTKVSLEAPWLLSTDISAYECSRALIVRLTTEILAVYRMPCELHVIN